MMYNACDFTDFELYMILEFEDINMLKKWYDTCCGTVNRVNMSMDCTSFIINYRGERQGGGTYFDGLFGTNVSINFSGTPMFKWQNDTYFLADLNNPTFHPN
ncbi:MAG: hypothetical protein Ta2E_00630 [Mycoplasmoidaceae bacterium]|nr:MAG: hypothetical protein Ta2E_00630 [Mycoplasmoidaceae bacterium]